MPDLAKIQAINEQKERNERLLNVVKNSSAGADEVREAVAAGAEVNTKNGRAMLDAAKHPNYEVMDALIDLGALSDGMSRKYLASVCDYRGYKKADKEKYFELIEKAIRLTGPDDDYFEPYINNRAAEGDLEGLILFKERFELSDEYVTGHIYPRVIFEIIKQNRTDVLAYIQNNRDWIDSFCLDSAVAGGEEAVLEYILEHSEFCTPSRSSVATALFAGRTGVLEMLSDVGYDFEGRSEFFLEKACRATMSTGFAPLEYLLEYGYKLSDSYGGKTVLDNALSDGNFRLVKYIRQKLGDDAI